MEEQFTIPCVGAIIIQGINGIRHILMQERNKADKPLERGLIEIPAGKVRSNENIFAAIRREVKEETGLSVMEIVGENSSVMYSGNGYQVIDFHPYCCTQNLIGHYPVMLMVFICQAEGSLLNFSDESQNYQWVPVESVRNLVNNHPEKIFPMDIAALNKFTTENCPA